ncbi:autophagy-related protein 18f isoform X1 [Dendrobium catenatum]|uniref:autophagy-related protein 18f isoform X1 n=1 Tax=Dendrobium catenatum TaxID=906689 RepID=UPI0009F2A09E|nr:autophagy-related protein 18f isoform X1 [Dendrobium catenatum]
MRNDAQKLEGAVPRNGRGNGLFSLRAYLRIVSSGASTVASTVRSAGASVASSIAERYEEAIRDQVLWAGFDKVECIGGVLRQVLLLAYQHGFQVWDVEEADDVRLLASRHDGPVSFLQIQKKPIFSKKIEDRFADFRPLFVVAGDISFGGGNNAATVNSSPGNGSADLGSDNQLPSSVRFYSIRSHEYVHVLKFRSAVYSIRCGPRVVAISQASQIHCFNAATLEREYTILTYPVASGLLGSGSIGYGPLAVGPRWLAYSGAPVTVPNTNRVRPEHLSSTGLSSSPNASVVAHFAKESSKQLAAGIVTLGDMGLKKLTKYYSELMPDVNGSIKSGNSNSKANGVMNGNTADIEDVGMVIVRDIISKSIIVQIRAHKSPISALCFDPSGTLLVSASIHGHNINVFHILPSPSSSSSVFTGTGSSVHLYKLQRGITNAVIQDISFSDDSQWIMISSSRGTSHLFAISPFEGTNIQLQNVNNSDGSYRSDTNYPRNLGASKINHLNSFSGPITLSVVSRIKNGNNGWKGAVSGAAAAATGKVNPISGAIASTFLSGKTSSAYVEANSLRTKYYLLLFSSSGCIIQYVLRHLSGEHLSIDPSSLSSISHGLPLESDSRFVVEPLQKWDICHKKNRRDRNDNMDAYGEHGNGENAKLFQKIVKKVNSVYPTDSPGAKLKLNGEENNHLYISEVELQMHSAQVPLWTRPGISFQVVMDDVMKMEENTSGGGGEIEIEKISYRTVEARSEDLKPVLEYVHRSNSRQLSYRRSDQDTNIKSLMMKSKSVSSEHGTISRRSSSSSFDPMPDSPVISELYNGTDGNDYFGGFANSTEADEGFVNTPIERPLINHQLEHVNNGDELKMQALLESVNSSNSLELDG